MVWAQPLFINHYNKTSLKSLFEETGLGHFVTTSIFQTYVKKKEKFDTKWIERVIDIEDVVAFYDVGSTFIFIPQFQNFDSFQLL